MWRSRRDRRRPSEEVPVTDVAQPRPGAPVWGLPGACPRCGGHGYLDRIDLVNEVMQQHCRSCSHRWDTAKDDTVVVGG